MTMRNVLPADSSAADIAGSRPVVATFRSALFNPSEGFVQAQATGLVRYRPVAVGLYDKGHADPALRDRLLVPRSAAERLRYRLTGDPGSLADRLRALNPALLHAHFATDGLLALPLARRLGIPLVTSLRGYDVSLSRPRLLLSGRLAWARYALLRRRLMAGGDLFLAVSDFLKARAIAQGFPEERTITHYNGVDLDRFRPGEATPEPGLVLHVGRLVEKKGTAQLIEAFALARQAHPDARLVVIGEGPLRARLERQAGRQGLQGAVEWLGRRSAEETAGWMRRAWLLAAPSVTARSGDGEGLPNVVVEAAASGLPVVGTRHAGIPEAVADGLTGLLVAERDLRGLAQALSAILGSPALRGDMARAARRLAEERFDYRRQMERLEQHYDRLVAARASRRAP